MATGRFAPSPTGDLHLGNLRTALVAWLFARSSSSAFLIRMEDLDTATVREAFVASQLHDLAAIGLDWEVPVIHQSARTASYHRVIDQLSKAGLTYPCFCSRREIREAASAPQGVSPDGAYPGTCRDLDHMARAKRGTDRPAALRLRADRVTVSFFDHLAGQFTGPIDDFVLRRGDGTPAYNLAVVVDDAHQGIGQVVRGDDLLSSTPRHIYLAQLLGYPIPAYAHIPLALGPDGARLAKRHGSVTLDDLKQDGLCPAEVLSLMAASLGLARTGEDVSTATLLDRFDPALLPRQPWVPCP